jgi:hypothetical protein
MFSRTASNYLVVHRKAAAQVRSIILKLCGIGLSHLKCPPALLNAVIGIMLYGDFFTDRREREALMDVVERLKNVCAWSMRNRYQSLKKRWDEVEYDTTVHGINCVSMD